MGRLLSRDVSDEVMSLLKPSTDRSKDRWKIEQARAAKLEAAGFRICFDIRKAELLIKLGAVAAELDTAQDGPFWHVSNARVEGTTACMFLESDLAIVQALWETVKLVDSALAHEGALAALTKALNQFEGKLTEEQIAAVETVARLGDSAAVMRYLAETA